VIDPKTGLPNEETAYLLRYYNVFNTDQCQFDSIGQDKVRTLTKASINQQCNRVSSADQIIDGMIDAPNVMHGSFDTPCYLPALDQIRMPSLEYFHCSAAYYATLFHELVHSTGHKKRLNRFTPENFSDRATYSKEELVAELGSAFLSAIAGLDHDMGNTQAYIKSWLNVLRDNPSWITWAASRAQKACELICPLTITHQVEPLNA
jgi:antirestriction protein ArdC